MKRLQLAKQISDSLEGQLLRWDRAARPQTGIQIRLPSDVQAFEHLEVFESYCDDVRLVRDVLGPLRVRCVFTISSPSDISLAYRLLDACRDNAVAARFDLSINRWGTESISARMICDAIEFFAGLLSEYEFTNYGREHYGRIVGILQGRLPRTGPIANEQWMCGACANLDFDAGRKFEMRVFLRAEAPVAGIARPDHSAVDFVFGPQGTQLGIRVKGWAASVRYCVRSSLLRLRESKHSVSFHDTTSILICGWYGTETLGDKAILAGIVSVVPNALRDAKVFVGSFFPYVTRATAEQLPGNIKFEVVSIVDAIGMAGAMDLVIFGGGPIMAIDGLAEMEEIFRRANRNKVPLVLAGCGVGPLGRGYHNSAIGRILKFADVRMFRDARSLRLAQEMSTAREFDSVVNDPAVSYVQGVLKSHHVASVTGREVLLLGLREFPYKQYARTLAHDSAIAMTKNYEDVMVNSMIELVRIRPNIVIKPLPMCTNRIGGDDRWFYRRILGGLRSLGEQVDWSLLSQELSVDEYILEFDEARACVAVRFHALAFCVARGVPVVAVDYTLGEGKVFDLAQRTGVTCLSLAGLEVAELVSSTIHTLDRRDVPALLPDTFSSMFESAIAYQLF